MQAAARLELAPSTTLSTEQSQGELVDVLPVSTSLRNEPGGNRGLMVQFLGDEIYPMLCVNLLGYNSQEYSSFGNYGPEHALSM